MTWLEKFDKEDSAIDKRVRGEIQYNKAHDGGKELMSTSFDAIFSAYHDYRNSQQWN